MGTLEEVCLKAGPTCKQTYISLYGAVPVKMITPLLPAWEYAMPSTLIRISITQLLHCRYSISFFFFLILSATVILVLKFIIYTLVA